MKSLFWCMCKNLSLDVFMKNCMHAYPCVLLVVALTTLLSFVKRKKLKPILNASTLRLFYQVLFLFSPILCPLQKCKANGIMSIHIAIIHSFWVILRKQKKKKKRMTGQNLCNRLAIVRVGPNTDYIFRIPKWIICIQYMIKIKCIFTSQIYLCTCL